MALNPKTVSETVKVVFETAKHTLPSIIEGIVVIRKTMGAVFRSYFPNCIFYIFGPPQAGKTSLHNYLQRGTPRNKQDAPPEPTLPHEDVVNPKRKNAKKNPSNRAKTEDFAGEESEMWDQQVKAHPPDGIIYVLDISLLTSSEHKALAFEALNAAAEKFLKCDKLKVLHVFLNQIDKVNRATPTQLKKEIRDTVEHLHSRLVEENKSKPDVDINVECITLCPDSDIWPKADAALINFGAKLKSAISRSS